MSLEWNGSGGLVSDPEEQRVLFAALDSFRQYRKAAHYNVAHRRRQNFYALPTSQWQLLAAPPFNFLANLDRLDDAIDANADISSMILQSGLDAFGLDGEPKESTADWRKSAKPNDMDKASTTIRQLYRDWTTEGAIERHACYDPVLQDLARLYPNFSERSNVKVLVPGAGLGRSVFEICRLGFEVEGNELSYHQLMASNWILNQTKPGEQFDLYPFALTLSNHISREHQLKAFKVPDLHPGTELEKASVGATKHAFERMSMTAADFVILYGDQEHSETFDAVVTVFFLDTAPNVLRYIEVVRHCLKDGGRWINLGPLLWHFEERGPPAQHAGGRGRSEDEGGNNHEGIAEPGSVELTNEEVLLLVCKMGFSIEAEEIRKEEAGYIQNPESMMQSRYTVSHWIGRKV